MSTTARDARARSPLATLGINALLLLFFAFFMLPIVWLVLMSFKTIDDILAWPPKWLFEPTIANYRAILLSEVEVRGVGSTTIDFMRSFWNTLFISGASVVVSILLGVPAAYALSRYKFRGRNDIAFTFLSFRFGPELLVIIPIYLIFQRIRLYDTYAGLIWVYQLITLPMIVWIVRSYVDDVPKDFEDACVVDGYSRWRAVWRVVLPIIRPGIAASALLAFIYAWNNFLFSLVLGSSRISTITLSALKFVSAEALRYGIMSAGIVISFLPILIFSIFAQRYFVRGLSMGAIKR